MNNKIVVCVLWLVPEAHNIPNKRLEREIKRSLECEWLLKVEKVTVLGEIHHEMPSGDETLVE